MPSQRLRIARYLNILSWMCQAQSGWPKWQKYHALRGDTALEPKFYVTKRLALPRTVKPAIRGPGFDQKSEIGTIFGFSHTPLPA